MKNVIALALGAASLTIATPAAGQDTARPAPAPAATTVDPALVKALAATSRDGDRARDAFRHPAETLAFFRLEPDMKVGEYAPGGGWYSRVLGNYLTPQGKLVGLFFTPEDAVFDEAAREGIRKSAAAFPAQVQQWTGRATTGTQGLTLDAIADGDKGSFDRILVIRMMHNMMRWNFADSELKAMRDLL